ncbi:hypothetical protein PAXRUDRAFT_830140, partial [Paxillus rubicundulus Ve08.2h10]
PELHGWWRKNPAYNTAYCVADSGQNLAAEALLMFKRRDGGEGSKGLEKTAGVEGEVEDGENEDELEDEEGNVGVNGDHIMDESENLAIPTKANTDNQAGPSGLPANPTDDPDDPDGMAIDGNDLNMYEDCPPGNSAINGPPE